MGAKKKKPIIIDKQSQPWLFKEQDEDEKKDDKKDDAGELALIQNYGILIK